MTWFRNKLKEFGYTYKTRVVGTNIHTNQEKRGACVINVTYVGGEIEMNIDIISYMFFGGTVTAQ